MRLGLLQTKLGLVHFLRNHKVSPCPQTVTKEEFDSKAPLMSMKGGVILKIEKI